MDKQEIGAMKKWLCGSSVVFTTTDDMLHLREVDIAHVTMWQRNVQMPEPVRLDGGTRGVDSELLLDYLRSAKKSLTLSLPEAGTESDLAEVVIDEAISSSIPLLDEAQVVNPRMPNLELAVQYRVDPKQVIQFLKLAKKRSEDFLFLIEETDDGLQWSFKDSGGRVTRQVHGEVQARRDERGGVVEYQRCQFDGDWALPFFEGFSKTEKEVDIFFGTNYPWKVQDVEGTKVQFLAPRVEGD